MPCCPALFLLCSATLLCFCTDQPLLLCPLPSPPRRDEDIYGALDDGPGGRPTSLRPASIINPSPRQASCLRWARWARRACMPRRRGVQADSPLAPPALLRGRRGRLAPGAPCAPSLRLTLAAAALPCPPSALLLQYGGYVRIKDRLSQVEEAAAKVGARCRWQGGPCVLGPQADLVLSGRQGGNGMPAPACCSHAAPPGCCCPQAPNTVEARREPMPPRIYGEQDRWERGPGLAGWLAGRVPLAVASCGKWAALTHTPPSLLRPCAARRSSPPATPPPLSRPLAPAVCSPSSCYRRAHACCGAAVSGRTHLLPVPG